jgi:hypothetical protein
MSRSLPTARRSAICGVTPFLVALNRSAAPSALERPAAVRGGRIVLAVDLVRHRELGRAA